MLKALVSEYMSHGSYTESAQAFVEDLREEATAFGIPNHNQTDLSSEEDDHNASIRRRKCCMSVASRLHKD